MYIFCYKTCIISRILISKPLEASYKYTGAFNLIRWHADSSCIFNSAFMCHFGGHFLRALMSACINLRFESGSLSEIFLKKGTLSRGISCFQRLECMPEKDGMRLGMNPSECKPRGVCQTSLGHSWILFPKLDSCQGLCIFH